MTTTTTPLIAAAGSTSEASVGTSSLRKAAILLVSLEQPMASKLLAQLDRATVESVTLEIARLERIDRAEQEAVLEEFHGLGLRRMRFGFEDVARLEPLAVRAAYAEEDQATWALALAGAARGAQSRVVDSLEAGAAGRLRAALSGIGPFRLADTEAAQARVVERVCRLHDEGLIALPAPAGPDALLA